MNDVQALTKIAVKINERYESVNTLCVLKLQRMEKKYQATVGKLYEKLHADHPLLSLDDTMELMHQILDAGEKHRADCMKEMRDQVRRKYADVRSL